jgi:hypothetical protein
MHATGRIRTHDLSRRAAADLRLGPRCHWDRRYTHYDRLRNTNNPEHKCGFLLCLDRLSQTLLMFKLRRYAFVLGVGLKRLRLLLCEVQFC